MAVVQDGTSAGSTSPCPTPWMHRIDKLSGIGLIFALESRRACGAGFGPSLSRPSALLRTAP